MIGQLINAGAQVASNLINAKTARENTDKTNQANRELAEYQYSKDVEMWNRGNTYNSPTAQMQRLREAGLNPNLVYGSGSVAGNTSGQLPKYSAPTMSYSYKPPVDPLAIIGAFQDFRIRNAEYNNMKTQNSILQQQARLRTYEADAAFDYLTKRNVKLSEEATMATQERERRSVEAGWRVSGGEDNVRESNQWKSLDADLAYKQRQVSEKERNIKLLTESGRIKEKEAEFWDWLKAANILQGFGIKLPFKR